MIDWNADPWIRDRAYISPAKFHAIGFMALKWNSCEHHARDLFGLLFELPTPVARIISHDMGDKTLWEKITQLADMKIGLDVIGHLIHASKMYERCNNNRNQFTHPIFSASETLDDSPLRLARNKGPHSTSHLLDDKLGTIRKVCEEIEALDLYLRGLIFWRMIMNQRKPNDAIPPLPEKPPLPEFVWRPPPKANPKPKRQPRSSPE